MKRLFVCVLATGLIASSAFASDLDVSASGFGLSSITTAPGCSVDYVIVGELNDNLNEGLALVGFDLHFTGGALTQADAPASMPMQNFARNLSADMSLQNLGITNPAGFAGTVIGGDLIQCGGGQNTINNTIANAPFPLGTVITGVAANGSPEALLSGSLTVPMTPGTYELQISNVFGNVIKQGEIGTPFWKTVSFDAVGPGGAGTVSNLTVIVDGGLTTCAAACVAPALLASVPVSGAVDARQPHTINNAATVFGWDSIEVTLDCSPLAGVGSADFVVSEVGGDGSAPTITSVSPLASNTFTLQLSGPIEPGAWTIIEHTASGDQICLGFMPGDVNGDGTANAADITQLVDSLNNVPGRVRPDFATDLNRSNVTNASDITRLIDLLNGADAFTPWFNVSLPTKPAGCN